MNLINNKISTANFFNFFNACTFPIFFTDESGKIIEQNQSAKDSFDLNLLSIKNQNQHQETISRVVRLKKTETNIFLIKNQLYDFSYYPVFDDKDENIKVAFTITSKNCSSISNFISNFNHDLKQPLQALWLLLDAISECELEAFPKKVIGKIALALDNLGQLIDNNLYLSNLKSDSIKPKKITFPIASILNATANEYQHLAEIKNLEIKTVSTQKMVVSDPVLVEKIIKNLLSNAVRYTEKGEILVGCRLKNQKLRIEIIDTGSGLSKEQIAKIFNEFETSPINQIKKPAFFGLYIVYNLCNLINTKINCESKVGKGTLFFFDLDYQ